MLICQKPGTSDFINVSPLGARVERDPRNAVDNLGSHSRSVAAAPLAFPRGLFFFPLTSDSVTSPFAGKIKQEPSVYRDGPPYQRRGSLQLWQFLVTLLDDPANGHFIAWTGRGMEFKLIEPEEVRWRRGAVR